MKHEWKKQEKEIYGVKTKPRVVDVISVWGNRNILL